METNIDFLKYHNILEGFEPFELIGKVSKVVGLTIESLGPPSSVGDMCRIMLDDNGSTAVAEVIGFRDKNVILMPLSNLKGISPGCSVISEHKSATVKVGEGLLGRVLDGTGKCIDEKPEPELNDEYPIYNMPMNPLKRKTIKETIDIGIRSVNGLLTCGKGQRIGIFAGTGVGKSKLMGMISQYTTADVVVIALIGERGREVKEFIEKNIGPSGMKKSIVVAATSDQPPLIRMRGAYTATAISEYFRDQGKDVLLLMDSVTRFAMAQREIGLAAGEPPTTKGYTPSVFTQLPQLLERAGTSDGDGSITGIYTVLVEGDDLNEPVSDSVRSIIDGHIILARNLASKGHYPAIDILNSISRVMIDVVPDDHTRLARKFFEILATYKEAEDLIHIGAYIKGSSNKIDYAISKIDALNDYLTQDLSESFSYAQSYDRLKELLN